MLRRILLIGLILVGVASGAAGKTPKALHAPKPHSGHKAPATRHKAKQGVTVVFVYGGPSPL